MDGLSIANAFHRMENGMEVTRHDIGIIQHEILNDTKNLFTREDYKKISEWLIDQLMKLDNIKQEQNYESIKT